MGKRSDVEAFWNGIKGQYPYHAETPVSVKPQLVGDCGEHASAVLRTGRRTWGFKMAQDRDKFVLQYGGRPK